MFATPVDTFCIIRPNVLWTEVVDGEFKVLLASPFRNANYFFKQYWTQPGSAEREPSSKLKVKLKVQS